MRLLDKRTLLTVFFALALVFAAPLRAAADLAGVNVAIVALSHQPIGFSNAAS